MKPYISAFSPILRRDELKRRSILAYPAAQPFSHQLVHLSLVLVPCDSIALRTKLGALGAWRCSVAILYLLPFIPSVDDGRRCTPGASSTSFDPALPAASFAAHGNPARLASVMGSIRLVPTSTVFTQSISNAAWPRHDHAMLTWAQ